ncbi:hypothetical protein KQX54_017905 [Cotesia glomerata]|uniref:Uncharacterized protein n=1 Tax=Cotesia glomerata TaxID=32391 RepID=A0AAV7IYX5_COTGL|nr:hypothetical protein KQX54_017905 [Cotesia glomerata]
MCLGDEIRDVCWAARSCRLLYPGGLCTGESLKVARGQDAEKDENTFTSGSDSGSCSRSICCVLQLNHTPTHHHTRNFPFLGWPGGKTFMSVRVYLEIPPALNPSSIPGVDNRAFVSTVTLMLRNLLYKWFGPP